MQFSNEHSKTMIYFLSMFIINHGPRWEVDLSIVTMWQRVGRPESNLTIFNTTRTTFNTFIEKNNLSFPTVVTNAPDKPNPSGAKKKQVVV